METLKKNIFTIWFTAFTLYAAAQDGAAFTVRAGSPVTIAMEREEAQVVQTALALLERDIQTVFSSPVKRKKQGDIVIGTAGSSRLIEESGADVSALKGKKQAFLLTVTDNGRLVVAGSDRHGTAYGVMELSRLFGVSPWEWWADVTPLKRESFTLSPAFRNLQSPSVEYRGIFINDEDWGLLPWSNGNYEPSKRKGEIGPRTNERIFELLLRLRANCFWPAMHECSVPFFLTKGNREAAKRYGIYIGSSHCEPMACNAAGEWGRRGRGDYDYVHNGKAVYEFWEERVKEVAGQDILYTVGMRGVHDGRMQGAETVEEQKRVLEQVFADQRALLRKYVNEDILQVPQVFIPYKEVLDIYNAALRVPEDVTLMWCDDNYGYIRHFPTTGERARTGGNGLYYHVSYWGRPHDYLWLGTFSPALLYQQVNEAYERGIRKIWILNVGDLKPAEYQVELFLDMAWDMDAVKELGVSGHRHRFLKREFGGTAAGRLSQVMKEHYRLAYICKPEFLGNTRVEESDPAYKMIKDLSWSEGEIRERLKEYRTLSDEAERLSDEIPAERRSAYFQLVKYPVQAAAQMNRKLLLARQARHGKADWSESDAAWDSINALTAIYNRGKWAGIMDCRPRRLPVFEKVRRDTAAVSEGEEKPFHVWNGADATESFPVLFEELGYGGKAAGISKDDSLTYLFEGCGKERVTVKLCLLPTHPVNGKQLRVSVAFDGMEPVTVSYETVGRSEEWKQNVLRNQAVRLLNFPVESVSQGFHRLTVKALDEGVVIDRISLY